MLYFMIICFVIHLMIVQAEQRLRISEQVTRQNFPELSCVLVWKKVVIRLIAGVQLIRFNRATPFGNFFLLPRLPSKQVLSLDLLKAKLIIALDVQLGGIGADGGDVDGGDVDRHIYN